MTKTSTLVPVLGLLHVLTMVLLAAYMWGQTNVAYRHTVLLPANAPGVLTSDRYGVDWWLELLFGVFGLLLIGITGARLQGPSDDRWRLGHLVFAGIFLGVALGAVVVFGLRFSTCNTLENANANICNDRRYCCVFGTVDATPPFTPLNPNCPLLLTDCDPAVAATDLAADGAFVLLFVCFCIGVLLGVLHFVLGVMARDGRDRPSRLPTPEEDFDETVGLEPTEEPIEGRFRQRLQAMHATLQRPTAVPRNRILQNRV